MKLPKGLKVLKEPIKDNAGEPIYPMDYMCDHPSCFKTGKQIDINGIPFWWCDEHLNIALRTKAVRYKE